MKPTRAFVPISIIITLTLPALTQTTRGISSPQERRRGLKRAQPKPTTREEAYRANNLGVALLEQFKYNEAAQEFARALSIEPRLALVRINFAIALYNVPDLIEAEAAARAALEVAPRAPQPHYILGLIYKQQNRVEEASAAFRHVLEIDPGDTGANVQLGQLSAQQRNYTEAIALFRRAVEAEPYNGTALYNLSTALLRAEGRDEGQRLLRRFQELRESGAATIIGPNYFEQGRYAEAVASTGAEADLVDRSVPEVRFVDATAAVLPAVKRGGKGSRGRKKTPERASVKGEREWTRRGDCGWSARAFRVGGAGVTLFDFDDDGDLDLLDLGSTGQRLYRNDGGRFRDVSARSGALSISSPDSSGTNVGAVAGDYDNDGRADLFILRGGRSALYRNEGGGKFSDRTAAAGIPVYPYHSSSAGLRRPRSRWRPRPLHRRLS